MLALRVEELAVKNKKQAMCPAYVVYKYSWCQMYFMGIANPRSKIYDTASHMPTNRSLPMMELNILMTYGKRLPIVDF